MDGGGGVEPLYGVVFLMMRSEVMMKRGGGVGFEGEMELREGVMS